MAQRYFFGTIACLLFIPAALSGQATSATRAASSSTSASGELGFRMNLACERLLHGTEPTFTEDFILADIASTTTTGKRRFDEFHGDLSGRFLSAIIGQLPFDREWDGNKWQPVPPPGQYSRLLKDVIALQQPDGRFGRMALQFTPASTGREHMALLWGNGRLLVGLLDAATRYDDPGITSSAVRLGDFLLKTIEVCSTPEMVERLKDQKAYGYICFTQLTEGLAMLSGATGDLRYAQAAQKIYPLLPPRGLQHSHGFLSTLRGVMMIYDVLKSPADLAFVEEHYRELVDSRDYTPMGGVNEYFGSTADHQESLRDEGCSEADFTWLSLQLWAATRNPDYLERAELAYYNALSFNQFESGDFGAHLLNKNLGYRLSDQDYPAWWCCTMHGLRAMEEVKEHILHFDKFTTGTARYIDMYAPVLNTSGIAFSLRKKDSTSSDMIFQVVTLADERVTPFYFRKPSWAEIKLKPQNLSGKPSVRDIGQYLEVRRSWDAGDTIEIEIKLKTRIVTTDGRTIPLDGITTRTRGYLYIGPYLMGADGIAAHKFLSEPIENNVIYAGSITAAPLDDKLTSFRHDAHLQARYRHDGFPGKWNVRLRPVGDVALGHRTPVRTLLTFEP